MKKIMEATLEIMKSGESIIIIIIVVVVVDFDNNESRLKLWGEPFDARGRLEKMENLMEGAGVCASQSEVVCSFSKL